MAVSGKRAGPPSGLELRAYHEAGHAVAALLKGFSLTRVTISRHGRVAGTCEYQFRTPRTASRSGALRLARAGAAVALAGSAAQDAVAAERGWVAVDARTGSLVRPFAPGAGDDARVAKRFARLVHRSPDAQRAFLGRMRASTDDLLCRPLAWAAVRRLARTLLRGRTLCGEHAVESVLRAIASAGAGLARSGPRSRGRAANCRGRLCLLGGSPQGPVDAIPPRVDGG